MMGETGPMGLHSKGRKTDMKTAAKRERKTLRIVELALLLGAAAFLMTGVWALNTQRDLADKVVRLHVLANSDTEEDQALKLLVRDAVLERATEISGAVGGPGGGGDPPAGEPAGTGGHRRGDGTGQRL